MNDFNLNQIKKIFNGELYLHLNPNLKPLIKTKNGAWNHFKKYGYNEKLQFQTNNDGKKILVVMPTYNRPTNIDDSIKMILMQTFTNWFFLIIDDGSLPENKIIFRKIQEKYKDYNNILFLENELICLAFIICLDVLLENDFTHFTWISDDNIYEPSFLDVLASNNTFFNYSSFNIHNKQTRIKYINNSSYTDYRNLIKKWGGCAAFMWTKEAIKQVGYYNECIHGCDDFEYLIRTFKINSAECIFIQIPLMTFNIHKDALFITNYNSIIELKNKVAQQYLEEQESI